MNRITIYRATAKAEIDDQADYFSEIAGDDLAFRFLQSVDETVRKLARVPGLGGPWITNRPLLQGIRKQRVRGFPSHLLFYRFDDKTIEVLGLLHASRDIEAALGGSGPEPNPEFETD